MKVLVGTFAITLLLLIACVAIGAASVSAFDCIDAIVFRLPSYAADYFTRSYQFDMSEGRHKEFVVALSFFWVWGWVSLVWWLFAGIIERRKYHHDV